MSNKNRHNNSNSNKDNNASHGQSDESVNTQTSTEAPAAVENEPVSQVAQTQAIVTDQVAQPAPAPVVPAKPIPDVPALLANYKTKSGVIRAMAAPPYYLTQGEIHKLLVKAGWTSDRTPGEPIRYQHVRNVLHTPVKKTMIPVSPNTPVQVIEQPVVQNNATE